MGRLLIVNGLFLHSEDCMCRNVPCPYSPVESTVGMEVEQFTASDIVLRIHDIEVTMNRIDNQTVRECDAFNLLSI